VLPEVHLTRPVVNLEIDEQGRKNWLLDNQPQNEGGSRISIHALTFDDAELTYIDAERDIGLAVSLNTDAQGVTFEASGLYHGLPAQAQGRGGQVLALKDTSGAGKADVNERFGATVQSGGAGGTGVEHRISVTQLDAVRRLVC